jgi:AI-2 transport protein TqsA
MHHPSILKPILILTCVSILLVAMHLAASFLVPILMAVFVTALLSPIYNWLKRRRVPGGLALLLTIGVLVLVVIFLALLIGRSLTALNESLSIYSDQFGQRQAELAAQIESLSQNIDASQLLSAVDPAALVNVLTFSLSAMANLIKTGSLILIMTLFILAESPLFVARMKQAFGPDHFLSQNVTTVVEMMISYFGLRAIVNLVTATATGLMLWIFGIEYAGLWAVLVFFLSFIPYIGAFFAMIPPLLLAYAQGGLGLVIVIGLLSVVINSITENIVAPMVMGKGLSISPTIVFLSFIFWMFILGGPGALLAMPLTMTLILFMGTFAETRGLAAMVATVSKPAPPIPPSQSS